MSVTVCLNMIVKDEAHVIGRCLANVRPLIDHWVIVDTGSTDGTQAAIRDALNGIPGTLVERPWRNFGHNRTEAIEYAAGKADYILTLDADETLLRNDDFTWGDLTADAYLLTKQRAVRSYRVLNLVRDGLPWRWEGVLHEHLTTDGLATPEPLDGVTISSPREGARARDPLTYRRDALMLEQALLDDPDNTRDVFYLAQSYRDCEDHDLALRWYRRRADMGGWSEEVYIALLNIARLRLGLDYPWPEVVAAYLEAHCALPTRAEALYDLGMACGARGDWPTAWLFLNQAANTPRDPNHILFLEQEIYDWRAPLEAAVAAYNAGNRIAAAQLSRDLLQKTALPDRLRETVSHNLALAEG